MVERTHEVNGRVEHQTCYTVTSLAGDIWQSAVEAFARSVRLHWHVENKLRWALDIVFGDHERRTRAGWANENFSVICQMALNLLRPDDTPKLSVTGKRLRAGWDNYSRQHPALKLKELHAIAPSRRPLPFQS